MSQLRALKTAPWVKEMLENQVLRVKKKIANQNALSEGAVISVH